MEDFEWEEEDVNGYWAGEDYFNQLPYHILDDVFSYLTPREVINIQLVCKNMQQFAQSQVRRNKIEKDAIIIKNQWYTVPQKAYMAHLFPELQLASPVATVCSLEGDKQLQWLKPKTISYEKSTIFRSLRNPAVFFSEVTKFTAVKIAFEEICSYLLLMPKLESLVLVGTKLSEEQIYQVIQSIQLNNQDVFYFALDGKVEFSTAVIDFYMEKTKYVETRDMRLIENDIVEAMAKADAYKAYYNMKVAARPKLPHEKSEIVWGTKMSEFFFHIRSMRRVFWPDDSHNWI